VRVAALYDIHGNLPALEGVLEDVRQAGVDRVLIGGDILPGPMPRETISCLLGLEIPAQFILGNGEVAVLEHMAGRVPTAVPEAYRPIIRWNAEQLSAEYERIIAAWPKTVTVEIAGFGDVLLCHATPRNENEIFTRLTPEDQLLPVFSGTRARLVICGHTHMQFDRMIGEMRIVNAGSVGMPFGEPGAYWLLLGPGIELRRTTYDLAKAADRIRATTYPQGEDFAARNVLKPPSEQQMLELFSRVAPKRIISSSIA
jgi:predicted phosphodiesterase